MEKDNIFAAMVVSVVAFFSPAAGFFSLMVIAAMVDHFFGVWRVRKMREKFNRLLGIKQTLTKIIAYVAVVGAGFLFDRNLANEFTFKLLSVNDIFAKVLTLGLCLNEWGSINRNFKAVKNVSIWERLTEGISKAREMVGEVAELKKDVKK